MLNRRHLLGTALGTALALPGLAQAAVAAAPAAHPDDLDLSPFGSEPRLQPLRGWSDGIDRVAEGLRIEGRLPAGLSGSLYRNGPGLLARDGQRYRHWFDGDGLVQAWRFEAGAVRHQARFVQTRKFRAEQAAGRFLLPAFGTAVPAQLPVRGPDDMNTANTSVTVQGGRLYALWEGGSATELDPQSLHTRGPRVWAPELAGAPFSAHPKREADGRLWNFGLFGKQMVIYEIDAAGSLRRRQLLSLPGGLRSAMVHDFVVSPRYLAFLLPPLGLDPEAMRQGRSLVGAMRWNAAQPMRLWVIDKATLQPLKTLELPPALVFHFGNAWDEGDELHLDYVESDIDEFLSGRFNTVLQGHQAAQGRPSQLRQLRANLRSGQISVQRRSEAMEFPVVDPRVVAQRHRQLFFPLQTGSRWGFNALQRLDLDRDRVDRFAFDDDTVVEEHVLVPKPGSQREGEGWLLGTGFCARRQRSFCTVFDAQAVAAGPLARVWLPYAVPYGFHSTFAAT